MDVFSFKIAAYGLILGFYLCWSVTNCTTSNPRSTLTTATTPKKPTSNPASTVTTTESTTSKAPPENVANFKAAHKNESSITLEWTKKEGIAAYILKYNEVERNFTQDQPQYVVQELNSSTQYDFKLFTVVNGIRSTGANLTAATAPSKAEDFRAKTQNETSITLQWKNENKIINYIFMFNGTEKNFTGQHLNNPAEHTVSDLQNAMRYNFTLVTVFENIRGPGVELSASTAPRNPQWFKSIGQNETSITLQWEAVPRIMDYIVQSEKDNITVTGSQVIVQDLMSTTLYNFILYSVFIHNVSVNISSSGTSLNAATAPRNPQWFKSIGQNETSITLQWEAVPRIMDYIVQSEKDNITVTGSQVIVQDLMSTTLYNFILYSVFIHNVSENISSSGTSLTAATAPRNPQWFKSIGQNETSITLQWEAVPRIMDYIVQSEKDNITVTGSQVIVQDLMNTALYNFILHSVFIHNVSENISSSGTSLTAATAPRDATGLKAQNQTGTTITLEWNIVNNTQDYLLQIDGTKNESITASSKNVVTHNVTNRESGTLTSFILYTVFRNISSRGVSLTAATVPPKVSSVKVIERTTTKITLEWESARQDWTYLLYINSTNERVRPTGSSNITHSFELLQPGTVYVFHVTTEFKTLKSAKYEGHTVTAINCRIVDWHVTESSIQGEVKGAFTKAKATNGSHDVVSSGSNIVLFTGLYPGATYNMMLMYEELEQCFHPLTTIPPKLPAQCKNYAAGYSIYIEWDKPNGIWNFVEVTVSGQTHKVGEKGEQFAELPNFQPAKKYQVTILSQSGTQRSDPYVFTCATDARGVIAGAFFGVLLFLILVCVVAFIMLKRPDIIRQKKPLIGGSRASVRKSKVIPVAKFPSHFNNLSADENRGFSLEYEDLSLVGTDQTQKAAIIQENKPKNRFVNVLPYDRFRVKLSSSNDRDDYINASYMPGYNSDKEFIAAQGPMPSTVNDFWRMIWEQKVRGIVMVTNCTEGGRTKCEQYWPATSKPCVCGDLIVSTTSEEKESDWTLREFKIKHKQTSEERTVKHFHFTVWPDHGVPLGTEVLIRFRALVRLHIQTEAAGTPTVVHCSAGVGRTGTFIALDVLLQQLEKEKMVHINGFVHRMRLRRPHMVQTESQYVFLHQCIMDSLQPSENCEEPIYENQDMIYANATALREFHNNKNNV